MSCYAFLMPFEMEIDLSISHIQQKQVGHDVCPLYALPIHLGFETRVACADIFHILIEDARNVYDNFFQVPRLITQKVH